MPPNACAESRGEWWRSKGGRSHRESEGVKSAKSTLAWAPLRGLVQGTSTIPYAALQALCMEAVPPPLHLPPFRRMHALADGPR